MSKKPFILDAEGFEHWKNSLETEAVMAALTEFSNAREELAKEQLYENQAPDAVQRLHINKEAIRLANEFIADFVTLTYDEYRSIVAVDENAPLAFNTQD